jgi:cell wall-associated NlpC family hydrolase
MDAPTNAHPRPRADPVGMRSLRACVAVLAVGAPLVSAAGALGATGSGGVAFAPAAPAPTAAPTAPTTTLPQAAPLATLSATGRAHAPAGAPLAVRRAISAGNRLQGLPYRYGGGHASFKDTAYDCSGTVSYALHGARLLTAPLDSTGFATWGRAGAGRWITVYTNPQHAYMVVAGLRLDTSGTGGSGPRWQLTKRSSAGFAARHPAGL